MTDMEENVQKHLVAFCKYVPKHVEIWSDTLQKSLQSVEWLCNHAEQLRHVERAQMKHMEDFEGKQSCLQYLILEGIEEQIRTVKRHMDTLNEANFELRNKLSTFECSSLDLPSDSEISRGCGTQPELGNLLQHSLQFWLYFSGIMNTINECYRQINVRDEKSMTALEKSFKVNIKDERVNYLLALTQYVDSHNTVS